MCKSSAGAVLHILATLLLGEHGESALAMQKILYQGPSFYIKESQLPNNEDFQAV